LVAISYHVFGVNEFATRLPILLAIFLLVLLAVRWATKAFGERAGAYAGLFVTTAAGFIYSLAEALLSLRIAASFY
jgi:4-amino-4-deoxy-L-arabinose transferase-like glycosyltransferase